MQQGEADAGKEMEVNSGETAVDNPDLGDRKSREDGKYPAENEKEQEEEQRRTRPQRSTAFT
jgi:hypothetical protein